MSKSVTYRAKGRVTGPKQGKIHKRPTIPDLNCEPKFHPLAPKLIGHQSASAIGTTPKIRKRSSESFLPSIQWSFSDIIDMHNSLNHASNHCIGRIIANLPISLQRVVLLTFLKFLFPQNNRNQYINAKDSGIDTDHMEILKTTRSILNTPNRKSKRNKIRTLIHNGNICGQLDLKLLSHSISFLDQSSRCNASRVNLTFLTAATTPIFKQHLCINKSVRSVMQQRILEPQELEQFESIDWTQSYPFNKRGDLNPKSRYFRVNMTNLFKSSDFKTLKISTNGNTKNVLPEIERIGIRHAERLVIEPKRICPSSSSKNSSKIMEIPTADLHRLKYIECGMNGMQSLWLRINKKNGGTQLSSNPIQHTNDLKPFLIPSSEIREIRFHFHHGFDQIAPHSTTPHPIHWLWNIPKLESCHLRVTINSDSEFIKICRKMTKHGIVRKKANEQKFKMLVVLLDSNRIESTFIFSEHIRALYPNLESMTIHQAQHLVVQKVMVNIDWMLFYHLKEIKLELPNIQYGISILQFINKTLNAQTGEFRNLEVLHLLKMAVEYEGKHSGKYDGDSQDSNVVESQFITDSICKLVMYTSVLLKNRPSTLRSFNVDVLTPPNVHHQDVAQTYFRPHIILTSALLKFLKWNDIYDGYLRVNIPLNGKMFNSNKRFNHRRTWYNGQYLWDSKSLLYSKEISKNLLKLQVGIKNALQFRSVDEKVKSGNLAQKLILDLPGLCLAKRHQKVLLFVSDERNVLLRTA